MKRKSDEELFLLIKKGERAAFEELYHRYRRPLMAYTLKKIEIEEAEDLNHDLWINVWEKREVIRLKGSVVSYLFKAMRNRIIDFMARSIHVETYIDTMEQTFVQDHSDGADFLFREKFFLEQIEGLLVAYSPRAKTIIRLRLQGYNNHEIAKKLHLSEKTIRNQHSSILKYLRSKFFPLLLIASHIFSLFI